MTLFEFFNLPEEEKTFLMLQAIEKSIEAQLESLKQIQEDSDDTKPTTKTASQHQQTACTLLK